MDDQQWTACLLWLSGNRGSCVSKLGLCMRMRKHQYMVRVTCFFFNLGRVRLHEPVSQVAAKPTSVTHWGWYQTHDSFTNGAGERENVWFKRKICGHLNRQKCRTLKEGQYWQLYLLWDRVEHQDSVSDDASWSFLLSHLDSHLFRDQEKLNRQY